MVKNNKISQTILYLSIIVLLSSCQGEEVRPFQGEPTIDEKSNYVQTIPKEVEKERDSVEEGSKDEEIVKEKKKVIQGEFHHLRLFDSDVFVYITGTEETIAVSTGKPGLERLANMSMNGEIMKMNLGYFHPGEFEHGGMYLMEGEYLRPPDAKYMNMLVDNEGKMDITQYNNLTSEEVVVLKQNNRFVIGSSYSLVQDGEKNLEHAELFPKSLVRNPRSLVGQLEDGRFVLVVVDGRRSGSKGVTGEQSAEIMLSLGCIEATNFDGGGSSMMWMGNTLQNQPAEGTQRRIGSALFVVPSDM